MISDKKYTTSIRPKSMWHLIKNGRKRPSGKGPRLIILGTCSEIGWIPNTHSHIQIQNNTGNYHNGWLLIMLRSGLLPNFSLMLHLTVLLSSIMPHIIVVIVTSIVRGYSLDIHFCTKLLTWAIFPPITSPSNTLLLAMYYYNTNFIKNHLSLACTINFP